MPLTTKPQLASEAAGARLVDIAHAARIVSDVVASAKVITNNHTFDAYELKAALKGQSAEVKAAAMAAYNSAKNDATAAGKLVVRYDVTKKLDQAVAALQGADADGDGELSEKELAKLQTWTPLRLAMAAVTLESVDTGKMSTEDFGKAANKIMSRVLVMSEGDSPLEFVSSVKTNKAITPDNVLELFEKTLDKVYAPYGAPDNGLTAEVSSTAKAQKLLDELATADPQADDPLAAQDEAACYANLKKLFAANLTDVRHVRVGPKDDDGTMAVDQGTYVEMFLGKTADGKLAGMMWTLAET